MIVKTREEATAYCRANASNYFVKSKLLSGIQYYCCPLCGSGTHNNSKSDGALLQGTKNSNVWTCFSCKFKGDIIDFIAKEHNLAIGTAEAFDKAYELFDITIEAGEKTMQDSKKQEQAAPPVVEVPRAPEEDYSSKYRVWSQNLDKYTYHIERGISKETAIKYWLGYEDIYFTGLGHKETALIIPLSKSSYSARNTNKVTDQEQRYQKKGKVCLFNSKALMNDKEPIFITEGELDALSIIEAGAQAVALGSTSNMGLLVELLKKHKPAKGIVLCMDNDEAGEKARANFYELMKEAKLYTKSYNINVAGEYKDSNEALIKSRKTFIETVTKAKTSPLQVEYEQKHKSDLSRLGSWWEHIHDEQKGRVIPTGFKELDEVLGGGLGSGLIGFGAIPALGKTTLGVQIANNIAEAGTDILFFTLELDAEELISKTISRITALSSVAMYGNTAQASTSREVMQAWKWSSFNSKKQDLIYYARRKYEEYAERIYTVEGEMDFSMEQIIEAVSQHIEITGRKPVVFIDYLQILSIAAKEDRGLSDKAKADKLVKYLRKMAKKFDIPVVVISSFNRENYNAPVSFSAFKESGGIEYGADALIGLQFPFMNVQDDEMEKGGDAKYRKRIHLAKKQARRDKENGRPLPIEAVVLKSRYSGGGSARLSFLPRFNLFTDEGIAPQVKVDKELAKASEGKGSVTAKDILKDYIKYHYVMDEIIDTMYYGYNRAALTHKDGSRELIEAEEGKGGIWTIRDVESGLVLESTNEKLIGILD